MVGWQKTSERVKYQVKSCSSVLSPGEGHPAKQEFFYWYSLLSVCPVTDCSTTVKYTFLGMHNTFLSPTGLVPFSFMLGVSEEAISLGSSHFLNPNVKNVQLCFILYTPNCSTIPRLITHPKSLPLHCDTFLANKLDFQGDLQIYP